MKMVCPHCGVKGSAAEKLIGTKVKCPKCLGIFEVVAEVVQPIAFEEIELEPVASPADDMLGIRSDQEVDDVFNDLLGRTDSTDEPAEDSELEKLLRGQEQVDEDSVIAALTDMDEEEAGNEWLGETEDETLTVIEDFPEEALVEQPAENETEQSNELSLGEDDYHDEQLEQALTEHDVAVEEKVAPEDAEEITAELAEQDEFPRVADEPLEEKDDILGFDDDIAAELAEQKELPGTADELHDEKEEVLGFDEEVAAELSEAEDIFADEQDQPSPEVEPSVDIFATEHDGDDAETPTAMEASGETDIFSEDENDQEAILARDGDEVAEEIDLDEAELEFADDADIEVVGVTEAEEGTEEDETEVDEGVIIQKCAACHEYVDPDLYYAHQDNVYCSKCIPPGAVRYEKQDLSVVEEKTDKDELAEITGGGVERQRSSLSASDAEIAAAAASVTAAAVAADSAAQRPGRFTVSTLIKDAYHYSKGAKGSLWGGVIIMYLILAGLGAASVFLLPAGDESFTSLPAFLLNASSQLFVSFISYLLTAGVVLIAVHKVGQLPFSWKMVFRGFSRFGSVLGLFVLQMIMLTVGFLLFILPGIYLSIGYVLAIPLVFMKNYSPWQALEESRKAVHKRWWTVFFAFIAMSIITAISAIPAGIGLIWTIPMFVVLVAVLYYHFFGAEE